MLYETSWTLGIGDSLRRLLTVDRHAPVLAPGRISRLGTSADTFSAACSVPPASVGRNAEIAKVPHQTHTMLTPSAWAWIANMRSSATWYGRYNVLVDLTEETGAFGDLLRHHRILCGMSQAELAERARLSARAISDLERGVKRTPSRETVWLLVEALELSGEAQAAFVGAARKPAARPRSKPAGRSRTSVPHALLTTKLLIPRTRPNLVTRPRLHEILAAGRGTPTLVSAPAGFGKTTLLANGGGCRRPVDGRSPGSPWTNRTTTRRVS